MHIKNNKENKIENKSGIYLIFVFLLAGQLFDLCQADRNGFGKGYCCVLPVITHYYRNSSGVTAGK